MFRFENISAFIWLYCIPIFLLVVWYFNRGTQKKLEKVLGQRMYPFLSSSISPLKRRMKLVLQISVVILMVVAMARPQIGQSVEEVKSQGFEMVMMIDVSESMMAEDVRPNRLEQAKAEMIKLVDHLTGTKIGIVAFAGTAVLISPLTTDPSALKMYIESLETSSVSTQGTNFESALQASKAAFERGGVDKDSSTSVTRAILIASDGEDHEPDALKMAEDLSKSGTKIFTLAYGTEKGGPIPVRDKMGFLRGNKKSEGETVITKVDGQILRKLAQSGNGSFYFASFGGDHISKLLKDFEKLEKSEFESQMATNYDENFQLFLFLAIILGILEISLGERRGGFRFWTGRFEVPPQ